jgi:hypothetical protein
MKRILLGIIALIFMPLAVAGKPATFTTGEGAIRGYDPVTYFTVGEPTPGKDKYSTR